MKENSRNTCISGVINLVILIDKDAMRWKYQVDSLIYSPRNQDRSLRIVIP